jgi:hypothetical protein
MMWVKTMFAYSQGLELDANDNIYYTGSFTGTVDVDPGPATYTIAPTTNYFYDSYLSRLDSAGNLTWVIQLQDTGYKGLGDIAYHNSGSIYCVGSYQGKVDFNPGPGTYTLANTSSNFEPFIIKFNAGPAAVEEQKLSDDIVIYPNPAQTEVYLRSDGKKGNGEIKLYNSIGQMVLNKDFRDLNGTSLNVGKMNPGIYFLEIQFDNGDLLKTKFVRE